MRRRFRFSLRALLVAMLVVAAFAGGMSVQRQLDRRKAAKSAWDIVVGVHSVDLEDVFCNVAEQAKAAADEKE